MPAPRPERGAPPGPGKPGRRRTRSPPRHQRLQQRNRRGAGWLLGPTPVDSCRAIDSIRRTSSAQRRDPGSRPVRSAASQPGEVCARGALVPRDQGDSLGRRAVAHRRGAVQQGAGQPGVRRDPGQDLAQPRLRDRPGRRRRVPAALRRPRPSRPGAARPAAPVPGRRGLPSRPGPGRRRSGQLPRSPASGGPARRQRPAGHSSGSPCPGPGVRHGRRAVPRTPGSRTPSRGRTFRGRRRAAARGTARNR